MKTRIQSEIKEGMKSKNTFKVNILKTILGEVQTQEARGKDVSDEDIEKIFRKFKEGAEETLKVLHGNLEEEKLEMVSLEQVQPYLDEIAIYDEFIPQTMSVEDIMEALKGVEGITEANSDGQATGVAMKHLKSSGAKVLGGDVSEAVRNIRNS
jgi:uncharacterized protein YqeY